MEAGDKIHVTHLGIGSGEADIISLSQNLIKIRTEKLTPSQRGWIDLFIGLSRPPTLKKILEHGTTLGVRSFHFFKADLSEKSYLQSTSLEENNYHKLLLLGLSQSRNYFERPQVKVDKYCAVKEYSDKKQKFILCLDADKSFDQYLIDFSKPITLAIGPERGWSKQEKSKLREEGFLPIKISSAALRVEMATFCAISQLEMLRGFPEISKK